MNLGFLTSDSELVIIESIRQRIPFPGIVIDEPKLRISTLGYARPMTPLGQVHVTVQLCRAGWGGPAEMLADHLEGRAYSTTNSHILIGEPFVRAFSVARAVSWRLRISLRSPWSPSKDDSERFRPRSDLRWVFLFPDATVVGCSISERHVTLYGFESKDLTMFRLGKLKATLEFSTATQAQAFGAHYPQVPDAAALDRTLSADVSRSKRIANPRRLASTIVFYLLLITGLALPFLLFLPQSLPILAIAIAFALTPVYPMVFQARTEYEEVETKFPNGLFRRWEEDRDAPAAGFIGFMKEVGAPISYEMGDLDGVDALLRRQRPETYSPTFAYSVAAYVAVILRAHAGIPIEGGWSTSEQERTIVYRFPGMGRWIYLFDLVARRWGDPEAIPLSKEVEDLASQIQLFWTFRFAKEFFALGFLKSEDSTADLVEAVSTAADAEIGAPLAIGETVVRARRIGWGEFQISILERELVTPMGASFVPAAATPFLRRTRGVKVRVDRSASQALEGGNLLAVRLEAAPMAPLVVEIENIMEAGFDLNQHEGAVLLDLIAVATDLRVIAERLRATVPEIGDSLHGPDLEEGKNPPQPIVNLVGKIIGVSEATNPLTGVELWLVDVEMGGFSLPLVVRKDRCPVLPQVGHFASAEAWLNARARREGPAKREDLVYFG